MMWRTPRSAQTSIPCKECKTPLVAERSCREIRLHCPVCKTSVAVAGYADKMDAKLEEFMSAVPCDRI